MTIIFGGIYFDSCAFSGGSNEERTASIQCQQFFERMEIPVEITESVFEETESTNTPDSEKKLAIQSIFSY